MSKAKKFDRCLKNLFTISGATCEDLAHHLGVTVPVVCRWVNGLTVPDMYQFREIAQFFGMPYDWFLGSEDTFPDTEDLSAWLGLSEETVDGLLMLAETESDEVMEALDDAVYALVSAVAAVREDADHA